MFSKNLFKIFVLSVFLMPFVGTAQDSLTSNKGYTGLIKIGFMTAMRINDFDGILPTLQILHGYRFNPHFALLGGVELNVYNTGIMPVLVAAKGTLRKKGTTPFAMVELGYGFELENDNNRYYSQLSTIRKTVGGLTFGAEAGMQFPIARKIAMTMSIGYRSQAMGYNLYRSTPQGAIQTEKMREVIHNVHVRVGVSF